MLETLRMRGLWSTKGLSSKRKEPLSEFACSAKASAPQRRLARRGAFNVAGLSDYNLEASASRLLPRVQHEVVLLHGPTAEGDLHRPQPGEVVLGDGGRGHRQDAHHRGPP